MIKTERKTDSHGVQDALFSFSSLPLSTGIAERHLQ